MREGALAKGWSFVDLEALISPPSVACAGNGERGTERNLQRLMDRMPVKALPTRAGEIKVHDRRGVECQELAQRQTADHTDAEGDRNAGEHRCRRCHQNRAEAFHLFRVPPAQWVIPSPRSQESLSSDDLRPRSFSGCARAVALQQIGRSSLRRTR
jgi:hypothetical protein